MIPERFSVDLCRRFLSLLDEFEPAAQRIDLRTSFLLMAAMPLLIVPLERTSTRGGQGGATDVSDVGRDPVFSSSLRRVLAQPFAEVFLRNPSVMNRWRASVIRDHNQIDQPAGWKDALGRHPIADGAINHILELTVGDVWKALRNALAHANVVYLDERGHEDSTRRVTHLGFVSRLGRRTPTYRVLIVEEEAFSTFLRDTAALIRDTGLGTTLLMQDAA